MVNEMFTGARIFWRFTGRDKLDRLLFFNLYFWRSCYVSSVACDNRNHFVKCSTTQSLNSLSSLRPNFSSGALYQHLARQIDRHSKDDSLYPSVSGVEKQLWTQITLSEKPVYSFCFFWNSRGERIKHHLPVLLILN